MKTFALRWIVPALCIAVFLVFMAAAANQRSRSLAEFNKTLETTLLLEGEARAEWLSDRLDPFYAGWRQTKERPFPDWSGASWLLLDASGEIALDRSGDPLYADPEGATAEVDWGEDSDYFKLAVKNEEPCVGPAHQSSSSYRLRVFIPVSPLSESVSSRWILIGQAGKGADHESYLSSVYEVQRRFWRITTPFLSASLLFLILLIHGILRTSRLEKALRNAEESVEIESLTSTLAHELRNPLSIIQSCGELLRRDEPLTEDGQEMVEDLLGEVAHLQDVLLRHLHPERYMAQEIEDLPGFSAEFWDRRQALLQTHNISLAMACDPSQPPLAVQASPDVLERIFDNLIRNSIEAMSSGGEIHYEVTRAAGGVRIVFRDTGPGLRKGFFFTREGWTVSSNKPEGKGIGLRLAEKWVRRWGGTFSAGNYRTGWLGRVRGARIEIFLKALDATQ